MATNYDSPGEQLNIAVPSGVTAGDPTLIGSLIPCVALTDRDSDGNATVRIRGIFRLSVKGVDDDGNSAVAVGDRLYWTTGDTPKINKKVSGALFGVALEAVTSGGTSTIKVLLAELGQAAEDALAAHIADPAALTSAAVTDNSGGSADTTIAAITNANNAGSADVVPTANAIADLAAQVNALNADLTAVRTALVSVLAALDNRVTAAS